MKKLNLDKNSRIGRLLKQLSKQLPLAGFAAIVIISFVIATPYTEKYVDWLDFDMNVKEGQYNEKTYVLQVSFLDGSEQEQTAQVSELKNILNKRLDQYGVEVVRILDHKVAEFEQEEESKLEEQKEETITVGDEEELDSTIENVDYKYLKVTVQTTKDMELVDRLIRLPNRIQIVTPKEDAVLEDPENPLAPYLVENYDLTEFTRESFRNVIVKELPSSTGETAFFAIYKVKAASRKALYDLLDEYAGTTIGVSVDGFVTPYNVPVEFDRTARTSTSFTPEFSPVVGQDPEAAKVASILLNAGIVSADYEIYEESTDPDFTFVETDYTTVIFVVIGIVITLTFFLYFMNDKSRQLALQFILNVLITNAFWLVILKYFSIEIDLSVAVLAGIFAFGYICILIFSEDKRHYIKSVYLLSLLILSSLSAGLFRSMFLQLLILSVLATTVQYMNNWFLNNIKSLLAK